MSFLLSAADERCDAAIYLVETGPVECAVAGFGVAYCVSGQDGPGGGANDNRRGLEALCRGIGPAQARPDVDVDQGANPRVESR